MAVSVNDISKVLECAICLATVSNPKTLSCNHSYCKRCLDNLLDFAEDGSATIKCPKTCAELTKISKVQTTHDLGVDYMLKGILDLVSVNEEKDSTKEDLKGLTCESGTDCKRDVTIYCIKCDAFICQPCSSTHSNNHILSAFVPVKFDIVENTLVVLCDKHSAEATYMCCSNKFVCVYCIHRNHAGHSYDTVDSQAAKLKEKLRTEIERLVNFTTNLNGKLYETESDISTAKENLSKWLKKRKLECITDYINYLNKDESRIKEEFDLLTRNHVEKFNIVNPTHYYEKHLPTEGINIVLQKSPIISRMREFSSKLENITEIAVALSNHSFNDVHPLGDMYVKFGEKVPIDKERKTFKNKFITEGVRDTSTKLLQKLDLVLQGYCKDLLGELNRKREMKKEKRVTKNGSYESIDEIGKMTNGEASPKHLMTTDRLSLVATTTIGSYAQKGRNENGHTEINQAERGHTEINHTESGHAGKDQTIGDNTIGSRKSRIIKETNNAISVLLGHTDLDQYEDSYTETKRKLIDACLQRYKKEGSRYIEELIKSKKNDEMLILLCEDPHIINITGASFDCNTPIHMAAEYDNIELAKKLLEHDGSLIDVKNGIGSSVLHVASYHSSYECCTWLIQSYPHLINQASNGYTALHYATSNNDLKTVKLLLNYGADILIKDIDGLNPLDWAKEDGCSDSLHELQRALQERGEVDDGQYADCKTVGEYQRKHVSVSRNPSNFVFRSSIYLTRK